MKTTGALISEAVAAKFNGEKVDVFIRVKARPLSPEARCKPDVLKREGVYFFRLLHSRLLQPRGSAPGACAGRAAFPLLQTLFCSPRPASGLLAFREVPAPFPMGGTRVCPPASLRLQPEGTGCARHPGSVAEIAPSRGQPPPMTAQRGGHMPPLPRPLVGRAALRCVLCCLREPSSRIECQVSLVVTGCLPCPVLLPHFPAGVFWGHVTNAYTANPGSQGLLLGNPHQDTVLRVSPVTGSTRTAGTCEAMCPVPFLKPSS